VIDPPEHVDVLVVGAGLGGIGAAVRLRQRRPGRSIAVLEARSTLGGTWDLFRYPGVRSDSDMFTLGYPFRPWRGPRAIADGASILAYLHETARECGVEELIRYGHRVTRASWSSRQARWQVEVERTGDPEPLRLTCDFLFATTGYYRYEAGWTPPFEGRDDFTGPVVHPQTWPAGLDVTGRKVAVIGSGATAFSLVPALARAGASVTMVQRSPSYVLAQDARDTTAERFARILPAALASRLTRWRKILLMTALHRVARRAPRFTARQLIRRVADRLGPGAGVDPDFVPRYRPWDQRLCVVPDGDLFTAIRSGAVRIVTDRVERFTPAGLRLGSGAELEADVVVTATGLDLLALGGIALDVDGVPVDVSQRVAYRGIMLSDVPNLAFSLGYTTITWTLRSDLAALWVCRLLDHLDKKGRRTATARGPGPAAPTVPFTDLTSGYLRRAVGVLPRRGLTRPWRLDQNYPRDVLALRYGRLDDGVLELT
jgi:monooxygenase